MAAPVGDSLQRMLQAAVQSVQWTYTLFWEMCPQQGVLVWGDGYYNGAIKTRKTIQSTEVTAAEASLQRSQQLRELYDSLSGGETDQPPARRPSASLSPEDLTESEWFYLICVSFSFPPGSGLPGNAYAKKRHVWLAGANESDSKTFSRAILAKSACVQTVVCIPILGGVVEFGTTERVEEDIGFINHVKTFFTDQPPKPSLSGHSTSNYAAVRRHSPPVSISFAAKDLPVNADEDEEDGVVDDSDSEAETGSDQAELMQLEMSEDARLGSPENASNNCYGDQADRQRRADLFRAESARRWPMLQQEPLIYDVEAQPPVSGGPMLDELSQEETHYSHIVSTVLQNQPSLVAESASTLDPPRSVQSAFARWTVQSDHHLHVTKEDTSTTQLLLKYVLFTVPLLHNKDSPRDVSNASSRLLSVSHVVAERRRREKLNERFVALRSLVPFVTKMDKASILGDTIEYLKQLVTKIHDLETRNLTLQTHQRSRSDAAKVTVTGRTRAGKLRIVEATDGGAKALPVPAGTGITVQVSIIESDALVELQCPYREGLLLDVMLMLRELRVEITTVQSSVDSGAFQAEVRAKVKDNGNGKRASIVEVKRAISQIIPQDLVA